MAALERYGFDELAQTNAAADVVVEEVFDFPLYLFLQSACDLLLLEHVLGGSIDMLVEVEVGKGVSFLHLVELPVWACTSLVGIF